MNGTEGEIVSPVALSPQPSNRYVCPYGVCGLLNVSPMSADADFKKSSVYSVNIDITLLTLIFY